MEANRVTPNANTYYVPEVLGDDFIVTGVEYVIAASTGQAASSMFYMPAGSDIQTIIASYANTKLANTIASATMNPPTHEFIEPNMIRMFNNYSLQNPNALKPYFEYFEEQLPYDKIRLALAIIEKENQE
jgi:superfamily II DNA/RNA helicase